MKKSLLLGLSTLALITTATASHARMNDNSWYVCAGASWIATNMENKYSLATDVNGLDNLNTTTKKIGLEDKDAFGGTFLVGYNFDFMNWDTFVEFSYGFDSTTAESRDTINHGVTDSEDNIVVNRLRRPHTYALGIGVNKNLSKDLAGYFKLSALFSQFDIINKMEVFESDTSINKHVNHKKWALGWAPTVGLSKELGNGLNLRADYSYQMYATVKKSMNLIPGAIIGERATTNNKIKPRYHVVGITLTKAL